MTKASAMAIAGAALMLSGFQAKSRDPGPPDERQIAIGDFDRIAVGGPFLVRIRTGQTTNIALSGPSTMLDDTEMFVRDGQLIVRWQEGASWQRNGNHGVDIDIMVPTLREATNFEAGSIEIDRVQADGFTAMLMGSGPIAIGSLAAKTFKAQVAGSGSLMLGQVAAAAMQVDLGGSGGIRAKGRVDHADLNLMGSGSFDNPDFSAREANIVSASSGVLRAMVTHKAAIQSMGSGDIALTGGAKCSVSKAGSGNVHCS